MKNLKDIIIDDISSEYDEEILKKEFNILESILNDKDLLLKKQIEYKEKYVYLSENFTKEFKLLNKQHYMMVNALKDVKFKLDNSESKELLIASENEVLKNIKDTFQTIVNKKEKTLYTYKYLQEIVEKYIYMKEDLVS